MPDDDPPVVPVKKGRGTKIPIRTFTRQLEVELVELAEQCQLCMLAFAELEQFARKIPPISDEDWRNWNRMVWSKVQAVLAASSAISRLLWPNPDSARGADAVARTVQRGRMLRGYLSLGSTPPLYHRDVRNAFEHVDERLDDWVPAFPGDIPLGWAISTLPPEEEDSRGKDAFRYVNLRTMDVRVAGARCNLERLADMAGKIRARIPLDTGVIFEKVEP